VANAASRFRPEHTGALGYRGIPVGCVWAVATPALPCGLQPGLFRVPPLAGLLARFTNVRPSSSFASFAQGGADSLLIF